MDHATYYWLTEARTWRKRARAAELQRDKLLKRCAALDKAVSEHREAYKGMIGIWGRAIAKNGDLLRIVQDAQRVLGRYHRGTNGKEMAQIVADAQAFLRLITHPWEGNIDA